MTATAGWWYVCHNKAGGEPVCPLDDPRTGTDCFMVYGNREDCEIACQHQRDMYEVACSPKRLPAFPPEKQT